MISLPNRSLNQDESFFTNSAYCGKGCFFTAQKQSQAGCWHAWNGREQHYLFLGSLSFETSPILLYLAVDVFFGDRNINSQFREEHFFFGGGVEIWLTNMFLMLFVRHFRSHVDSTGRFGREKTKSEWNFKPGLLGRTPKLNKKVILSCQWMRMMTIWLSGLSVTSLRIGLFFGTFP